MLTTLACSTHNRHSEPEGHNEAPCTTRKQHAIWLEIRVTLLTSVCMHAVFHNVRTYGVLCPVKTCALHPNQEPHHAWLARAGCSGCGRTSCALAACRSSLDSKAPASWSRGDTARLRAQTQLVVVCTCARVRALQAPGRQGTLSGAVSIDYYSTALVFLIVPILPRWHYWLKEMPSFVPQVQRLCASRSSIFQDARLAQYVPALPSVMQVQQSSALDSGFGHLAHRALLGSQT